MYSIIVAMGDNTRAAIGITERTVMRPKRPHVFTFIFLASCLFAGAVVGMLGARSLEDLVANAPIICTGTFGGGAMIESKLDDLAAGNHWLVAGLTIDHVMKGTISTGTVQVVLQMLHFEGSLPESATNELHMFYEHKRCVVFMEPLIAAQRIYQLAQDPATKESAFDSILPTSPRSLQNSNQNLDAGAQLEDELIGAAGTEDKQAALSAIRVLRDWGRRGAKQKELLDRLSGGVDEKIVGVAMAMRIERGDVSALTSAVTYAESHAVAASEISESLRRIRNPQATVDLVKFMNSKNAELRRAAMSALRNLASEETRAALQPVLRAALDDTDKEVQYHAMLGLAYLAGDAVNSRGFVDAPIRVGVPPPKPLPRVPGFSVFMQDPDSQTYINDWKKYESEVSTNQPHQSP